MNDEDHFEILWRVESGGSRHVQPYYHIPVVVFLHQFEDGEDVILVHQDYLDDHEDDRGPHQSDYARANIDGTPVDPDDVFSHPRIDNPEEVEA